MLTGDYIDGMNVGEHGWLQSCDCVPCLLTAGVIISPPHDPEHNAARIEKYRWMNMWCL